jgi:hypothetical protein
MRVLLSVSIGIIKNTLLYTVIYYILSFRTQYNTGVCEDYIHFMFSDLAACH